MEPCQGCGFEYDLALAAGAGSAIRAGTTALAGLVEAAPDVSVRRQPDVWSPLEYACHVRDVLLVQRERTLLARWTERPSVESMGRDERVDYDGYASQDVGDVLRQLSDAALLFANVLSRLDEAGWDRKVIYHYPTPAERSLRWVAVHTLHEVRHHLGDIEAQVA